MRYRFFSDMNIDWMVKPEANDIMEYNVFDKDSNEVGEIVDLLVDGENNDTVNYVLVDQGWIESVFGIKRVVVPLRKMLIDTSSKSAHLDISREELRRFPDYALDEPNVEQTIDSFWGNEPYSASIQRQKEFEQPQQPESAAFAKEREPMPKGAMVIDKLNVLPKVSEQQKEAKSQAHGESLDMKEHGPEEHAA